MPRKSKLGEPNAFWKHGSKFHDDPWVTAIAAIDNDDDNAPLIEMLLSDAPLDGLNRSHLAHLLYRKKFKNKEGQSATPSYAKSFADDILVDAVAAVRDLMAREGVDERTALEQISESRRIDLEMLAGAKSGKLGSARRAAERMQWWKKK